jgi:hypothetical protein
MARSPLRETFQIHEKFGLIASHLLVSLMMVCFAISLQHLAQRIVTGWQGGYIPWLALLVSLEAQYSRREVRRESDLITSRLVYRLIEWVVIALFVKAILYASDGIGQLWADLPLWQEDFLTYFFDGEYVFALLLSFMVWAISGGFSGQLLKLEGDKFLLEMDVEMGLMSDRSAVRRQLAGRIFSIGMVMILFSALVRWDYQAVWGDRPVATYNLSYVMLYFLFGFALITLTHFAARRAVWALERTPLSRNLSRQWLAYSSIFLVGVTLLAFILPTGYSMGLLATLAFLFNLLLGLISFLFYLLSLPFIYLLNLFFNLTNIPEQMERPVRPEINPLEPPPGGLGAMPWWEVVRSIFFWALFLAVSGYALIIFIRQNQSLVGRLRAIPGWKYLAAFWEWLSSGFARAKRQGRRVFQNVLVRLRVPKDTAIPVTVQWTKEGR